MLVDDVPPRSEGPTEAWRPVVVQGAAARPGAGGVVQGARPSPELVAARSALIGASVIDTTRAYFANRAEVDAYLRLNEFDTDNPLDLERLAEIYDEAVGYLTEVHGYRLPQRLEKLEDIHELFTLASGFGEHDKRQESRRVQRYACMILKVMHIMHHLHGRELVFTLPISEAQLFERLNAKVLRVIDGMRRAGVPVVEFATGKKARASLISKLLAKRTTLAAHIFDAMRFRVVVQQREDVVKALVYLAHNLFPFNFVIPDQSQNTLLTPADVAKVLGHDAPIVEAFFAEAERAKAAPPRNEFSGATYRSVNFVVDIPLRLDDVAESAPAIAFVMAEIQLVDAVTDVANNTGENSHALYKKRQREQVRRRLEGADLTEEAPERGAENDEDAT